MERPKYFVIVLLLLIAEITVAIGPYKIEVYNAYIGNRMDRWKAIIDKMDQEKTSETEFLLELINYQYGYIGWCIGNNHIRAAEKYLELAENNLERLEALNAGASITHAYKSAFYGFKIGLSRMRAPFFGPRSVRHARLAMEHDNRNPMGYIQYGNSQFYMPAVFGGSKKEAIVYFQKAQDLMEQDGDIKHDWNYLSLLTLIAQSFEEMKEHDRAKEYYEKILEIEPQFLWVKNELYPEFLQKMKGNE
jgi:tetratricopeptide (TPR) repeat protein